MMIPGPYSICQISFPTDSDAAIYTTIQYGYSDAEEAFDDISRVAEEWGIPAEQLVVIRLVEKQQGDGGVHG